MCVYSSISPETLTRSSANESANSLKSSGWGGGVGEGVAVGCSVLWTLTNLIVRMKLSCLILAQTSPMAH